LKQPSSHRKNAERGEKVAAHPQALRLPLQIFLPNRERSAAPGEKFGKGLPLRADLIPECRTDRGIGRAQEQTLHASFDLYFDQGGRVSNGKAAQTDGVQQLEDGAVSADAQSESEDGGGGENRALAQSAEGEEQVLQRGVQPERATRSRRDLRLTVRGQVVSIRRFV